MVNLYLEPICTSFYETLMEGFDSHYSPFTWPLHAPPLKNQDLLICK